MTAFVTAPSRSVDVITALGSEIHYNIRVEPETA